MSERKHDDFLKSFIEYASYGEAPMKSLFWTGVSTVAGALRRRVWIEQKYFQWTPNFYVILVAPPGIIAKSTTANIGMNLLREVPGIKFGPDVVTWQALVEALGKSTELALDTSTGEYLPMSALTIASDEFGTFLDPNDRGMVDALVSLWDGKKGTFSKVTKSSGSDSVENPWVNIIACTTPGWIEGNFPEYMVGGGFTSRCVFVYTEKKRQLVAYPSESVPDNFEEMKRDLVHDLEIISTMIGEYKLTEAAKVWGRDWYAKHWETRPAHLDNDRFGGYLARKQTHIHKLSIVLSASESSHLEIRPDNLKFAEAMITSLERDMPAVFATIGQTDQTRGLSGLVKIVLMKRKISQVALYRLMFRTMGQKEFQEALSSAVLAGYLKIVNEGGTPQIYALEEAPKTGDQ